jgi:hypothetical protein
MLQVALISLPNETYNPIFMKAYGSFCIRIWHIKFDEFTKNEKNCRMYLCGEPTLQATHDISMSLHRTYESCDLHRTHSTVPECLTFYVHSSVHLEGWGWGSQGGIRQRVRCTISRYPRVGEYIAALAGWGAPIKTTRDNNRGALAFKPLETRHHFLHWIQQSSVPTPWFAHFEMCNQSSQPINWQEGVHRQHHVPCTTSLGYYSQKFETWARASP